MNPAIMENFDLDRVARDSQELFGFPPVYLLPEKEVAGRRKQRAQQQQDAAQMQLEMQAAQGGQA
jgi:hypothetical protein